MCFLHSAQIVGVPFSRLAFVRKRQCLRSCVFRLGMCTQNKQTDLQLRNACAKWECCASSAFQGDSHQAFEVPWYELSSVCLSLNFDGMSQSCCRVSSVSTQCHLNDRNPGKKTLTTYSNVDFFHYHHYVATKFQKRTGNSKTISISLYAKCPLSSGCLTRGWQVFVFPFLKPTVSLFRLSHPDYIHHSTPTPSYITGGRHHVCESHFYLGSPARQKHSWGPGPL